MVETKERTFVNDLSTIGIETTVNKGKDQEVFLISLNEKRNVLRVTPGKAKVEAHIDEDLHQAVLTVKEPKREVVQRVSFKASTNTSSSFLQSMARSKGEIVFPPGTRFGYKQISKTPTSGYEKIIPTMWGNSLGSDRGEYSTYEYDLIAKIPDSTQSLLVGYDETHMFICMLPQNVKSVKRAHEVLRPKGLKPGWKRQGEWFFSPASKEEVEAIQAKIQRLPYTLTPRVLAGKWGSSSWVGTQLTKLYYREDHTARMAILLGRHHLFVSGVITAPRHKPLFLDGWFQVMKNQEVGNNGVQQIRTWD